MKKILVAVVLMALLAVGQAQAAEGTTWTSKRKMTAERTEWIEVKATVTCATNGSFTTTAIYENENAEAAGVPLDLAGYYLHSVDYYYGATGPADNSDLTLLEHISTGYDVLRGAGSNIIDNAANNYIQPLLNGTVYGPMPVYGPLYMAIANNNVNSATFTLIFRFVR